MTDAQTPAIRRSTDKLITFTACAFHAGCMLALVFFLMERL